MSIPISYKITIEAAYDEKDKYDNLLRRDIYTQTVDTLDVLAVIAAVNKFRSVERPTSELTKG